MDIQIPELDGMEIAKTPQRNKFKDRNNLLYLLTANAMVGIEKYLEIRWMIISVKLRYA